MLYQSYMDKSHWWIWKKVLGIAIFVKLRKKYFLQLNINENGKLMLHFI